MQVKSIAEWVCNESAILSNFIKLPFVILSTFEWPGFTEWILSISRCSRNRVNLHYWISATADSVSLSLFMRIHGKYNLSGILHSNSVPQSMKPLTLRRYTGIRSTNSTRHNDSCCDSKTAVTTSKIWQWQRSNLDKYLGPTFRVVRFNYIQIW